MGGSNLAQVNTNWFWVAPT